MSATPPDEAAEQGRTLAGRPILSSYDLALTLAKQLTPDQSLSRAADSAKWAVQTIALVATFLAGFGAVAGLSAVPTRHATLIVWTIVFSGLAVVSGILSLLPSLTSVDINKAPKVERHFKLLLLRRGILAIAAFLFLLTAISLAVYTSFEIERDPVVPTAALTGGWDGSGTSPVISADLSVTHAAPGTTIHLIIEGPKSAATGVGTLASASGTVGQNGTTEISLKFVPASDIGPFEELATDASDHPTETLATVSLSNPPAFASTTTTTAESSTADSSPVATLPITK